MKVKKVKMITEAALPAKKEFSNSTQDQFPYVEATLNTLDDNFNWWKENYQTLEQLILTNLDKSISDNMENSKNPVNISSRFTMFHGHDDKAPDVIWTGPAIVYTFNGASPQVVRGVRDAFRGLFEGHKIFADNNDLIVLFG